MLPPEWLSVSVRMWERKLVQPLEKTVWRFHIKVNMHLLCDPAVPLPDTTQEK